MSELTQILSAVEQGNATAEQLLPLVSLRELLGRNARKRVESHFTLSKQADAWVGYLRMLSDLKHLAGKPAMPHGS